MQHIFILSIKNTDGIEMEDISGMEKFKAIQANTYRFGFMRSSEGRAGHLKQSSMLASNVNITKIIRPRKGYFDKEIIERIYKKLGI